MAGIRQISQGIALGQGALALECHPDPLPDGFGITHRWEAYSASAEPTAPSGSGSLSTLDDLIGSADMTPNQAGLSGAIAPRYNVIANRVALGMGTGRRLMTSIDRSMPHTLVATVRPRSAGYSELSVLLGARNTSGARGNVFVAAAGYWAMNAGTTVHGNDLPMRTSQWQTVTAVFNGANSVLRVDGVERSGNAGSDTSDRLIIGSYDDGVAPMEAYVSAVYFAPVAWSAEQRAEFETWVRTVNRVPFA